VIDKINNNLFTKIGPSGLTRRYLAARHRRYSMNKLSTVGKYSDKNWLRFGAAAMPPQGVKADDIVIVERRENVRIIVSVPGYYSLADHHNPRGERNLYACRAVNVSTRAIALAAPVSGRLGERALATIDHLGKLEGLITRLLNGGFVMSIVASDEERWDLAAKIEWLEQYKNCDVSDQRGDRRLIPENPHSLVVFADGSTESCFVLDLSGSGAAISAQTIPDIGTVLAVGNIVARVVRHFQGGFAVQFIQRQSLEHIAASETLKPLLGRAADFAAASP
jgi:hypothetical protein